MVRARSNENSSCMYIYLVSTIIGPEEDDHKQEQKEEQNLAEHEFLQLDLSV